MRKGGRDVVSGTCAGCGGELVAEDPYCTRCGTLVTSNGVVSNGHQPARALDGASILPGTRGRRLGGTVWTAEPPARAEAPARSVAEQAVAEQAVVDRVVAAPRTDRVRRKRARRWFRRPKIVVPLTLLAVVTAAAVVLFQQAHSTVATLRSISTPAPVVYLSPEEGELGGDGLSVDTQAGEPIPVDSRPAMAAVEAAGEAGDDDGGGLFGGIRDVASDVQDVTAAAAMAAGVTEPSTEALNILIMGVDARPGAPIDISVRPDSLMVLRLDPGRGSCRLLAIPRDTRTNLPGYGMTKVNHALAVGGIPYQRLVVEQLLGITIDRYVLIDFVGFQALVDAVGGVPVTVPEDIVRDGQVVFVAGNHVFDGEQALAYARYRGAPDGDNGRIRRQWAILKGLVEVESGRDLVGDTRDLMPALEDHVRTDLTASELAAIAETYGGQCSAEATATLILEGARVRMEDPMLRTSLYYNIVDEAAVRERVAEFLAS